MQKRIYCVLILISVAILGFSQTRLTLAGKVVDEKSNPIAGASVHLVNTQKGTITDTTGRFQLRNIPAGNYTLQVTAIGFASMEQAVSITNASAETDIKLTPEAQLLDDILVSIQKREEILQDIPISATALNARKVQQYRIWNTRELTAVVPNLYSNHSGDERNVTSIRGITTTSYDPAVATYIDGVNQFNLDTYIANLFDVERIEVLRGPQGTLYGRNAMGGVINIITQQPQNVTKGFAELSYGNFNQIRIGAGIRTPIIKDKLYVGIAEQYNGRDGFYTNTFNNTSYDKQHGLTGNYYLKWIVNSDWYVSLNFKHQNNRNEGPFPLTVGVQNAFDAPFEVMQNAVSRMVDNTLNSSLSLNYSGSKLLFSSQTAYQSNHRFYEDPLDGDFSPIDGVTIINNYGDDWNKVKAITEEFRLSSPAAIVRNLQWTAGAYLFHQDNPVKQTTHFGEDAALLGLPDNNFSLTNFNTAKNTGFALFGQADWAMNKLHLILGARYDYENKKYSVRGEYEKAPDPAFVIRPDTSASANYGAFSPKIGFAYHFDEEHIIYFTGANGFRTGGFTQLSTDPSQPPLYPFKPEYSTNLELGSKNDFFNKKLRLNIVAFLTKVKDVQVPTLVLPDAITVTRNAGKLDSKGFEAEISTTPIKGLEIDYNAGYTHARFKELKLSQGGNEVDLAGNKQVFTPDVTSLLAAQYTYSIGGKQNVKLIVRGEWHYLGEIYFDLANTIRQAPYQLLHTRFGIASKHAELYFWGRNLTDQRYIAYGYDFGAVHLGDPKTYGITLIGKF